MSLTATQQCIELCRENVQCVLETDDELGLCECLCNDGFHCSEAGDTCEGTNNTANWL